MREQICTITENREIAKGIFEMSLSCDTSQISAPGQFINIKLEGLYLRRPISIFDYNEEGITIIYKVIGQGTKAMSLMKEGASLDVILPLGNGFDIDKIPDDPILIGGGVGVPPIYNLAKRIEDKMPRVYLGFSNQDEVFGVDEFRALGLEAEVKIGGYITDILPMGRYACACGPEVMLKAIDEISAGGQYSFEARMACGFGACMGCTCKTKYGYKRICKDGPVLTKEEILW